MWGQGAVKAVFRTGSAKPAIAWIVMPRCARYPRMAWIYGVFYVAGHGRGRIDADQS